MEERETFLNDINRTKMGKGMNHNVDMIHLLPILIISSQLRALIKG